MKNLDGLTPDETLNYAPVTGLHDLRSDRHRFSLPTRGGLLFACAPGQHGQAEAKGQGRSDTSQHERSKLIHGRRV